MPPYDDLIRHGLHRQLPTGLLAGDGAARSGASRNGGRLPLHLPIVDGYGPRVRLRLGPRLTPGQLPLSNLPVIGWGSTPVR